ncbi:unnamed protein product [Leuciscus chuanchicus]
MKTFPFVGQFLGRLCWNPCVIADERSQRLLLRCLSCLYSAEPLNAVERKANTWIKSLIMNKQSVLSFTKPSWSCSESFALERQPDSLSPHHKDQTMPDGPSAPSGLLGVWNSL